MSAFRRKKARILIVDDEPVNIKFLIGALKRDYDLTVALNGEAALTCINEGEKPDLILLDVIMPVMDGYETCRQIKADPETRDIPVIFITALGDEMEEKRGFDAGASDYIAKPFSVPIVKARISTHLELYSYRVRLERMVAERTRELRKSLEEYARLFDRLAKKGEQGGG